MDLRGQRFTLDLSDDEAESESPSRLAAVPTSAFIGNIKERENSATPPTAPKLKASATGFPEHKKRTRVSAFKQQRAGATRAADSQNSPVQASTFSSRATPTTLSYEETERQKIDAENKQRLASMSVEEIEEERRELFEGLDPSLIERFLKRANLDEGRGDTGIDPPEVTTAVETASVEPLKTSPPNAPHVEDVSVEQEAVPAPIPSGKPVKAAKSVNWADEAEPADPIALQPASKEPDSHEHPEIHFPNAPAAPELDPSDPSFLENLHTKYFPSLPADPTKLAWMAPIPTHGSVADQESPYYPAHEALPASALRFDFRGGLLPPRISRAMPSNKGLHHHGEAPEAAGYTVPELARLARSAFPAQRCVAFQTLGRLLYRLGRGEWGDEDSEITKGLWRCVEEGKVVQTLEEAASAEGGHQGSKVYAVEAVWLWQKGGGKVWKAS
ncbi:hypothetical protein BP6252_09346 [Coleophoma cylindrospora]|uniref:Transcription factor Rba50 n=1 Tax=Coleophoma cylindrospora TaxID=1849047 RepID=A0A3D8R1X5_9HELO|nr:hypothetical protein BP6252_09346 [Coleophoma cylindrospora]